MPFGNSLNPRITSIFFQALLKLQHHVTHTVSRETALCVRRPMPNCVKGLFGGIRIDLPRWLTIQPGRFSEC